MTDTIQHALPSANEISGLGKLSSEHFKKAALGLAVLAVVGAAAGYGRYYWDTGRYLVSTDDAYVRADFTTVAPKVSGYISEVLVADNQTVKTGRILAR